jgi:hypothetical protein
MSAFDPGWRVVDGDELYFVDDDAFVFTCCQRCSAQILKQLPTGVLIWQCEHGPDDDKENDQ